MISRKSSCSFSGRIAIAALGLRSCHGVRVDLRGAWRGRVASAGASKPRDRDGQMFLALWRRFVTRRAYLEIVAPEDSQVPGRWRSDATKDK